MLVKRFFFVLVVVIVIASAGGGCNMIAGSLLMRTGSFFSVGNIFIPISRHACDKDPVECSAAVEFKVPPSTGMIRVVGAKNIFLHSKQFEYKSEPAGWFGWSEKRVYQDFLPILLPIPDNNGIAIYKAVVVSALGGIQVGTIYLYIKEDYTLPVTVNCNGRSIKASGVASCGQFKDSGFSMYTADEVGAVRCGQEPRLYKPREEIHAFINDCQTLLKSRTGTKALVFELIVPDQVELPNVVITNTAVRIGMETELTQCGNKRFFKDRIETQLVDCKGESVVYQWAKDGRFRYERIK